MHIKQFSLENKKLKKIILILLQAISCLKKAIWLEPTNFNCLFNLGLIYLTALQYASAFHALAAAACIRPDNAECYMLLGSNFLHLILVTLFCNSFVI